MDLLSHLASVTSRYLIMMTAIVFCAVSLSVWMIWERYRPEGVIHLKNVQVLDQYSELDFLVRVEDSGQWNDFAAKFCPHSNLTKEIKPGATLTNLWYIEDSQLNCYNVQQPHTGYDLLRKRTKENPNEPIYQEFRKVNALSGSPATSGPAY